MNFIEYGTDDAEYEQINRIIIDVNVTNLPLIICKVKFGAIDDDDTSCPGYYSIIFISSKYTLQEDFNIYGQVIFSGDFF